jgi:hypothetical protein
VFPAAQKVPHSLFNQTDSPCRYMVFGNPQPHDVVLFPETGRVRVKVIDESYRKGTTMAYWDSVDVRRVRKVADAFERERISFTGVLRFERLLACKWLPMCWLRKYGGSASV